MCHFIRFSSFSPTKILIKVRIIETTLKKNYLTNFQYFGHLIQRANSLEKTLMLVQIEGKNDKRVTEDEMVGWHHRLNGHELEQTLGDSEGQGNLKCCSPWGHKESDMT